MMPYLHRQKKYWWMKYAVFLEDRTIEIEHEGAKYMIEIPAGTDARYILTPPYDKTGEERYLELVEETKKKYGIDGK